MIFDSEAMQRQRTKYAATPDDCAPKIVLLDRLAKTSGERSYLEELVVSVAESKRKGWLGRMLSDRDGQHLGAWFELMLYGWLRQVGEVHFEPEVEGDNPDFVLRTAGHRIAIEARVFQGVEAERELHGRAAAMLVSPEPLKSPLGEKAKQHKRLRKAGHPYILALFLEHVIPSPQTVTQAWFGRLRVVPGTDNARLVAEHDGSGLHYFGTRVYHKSVTGTLVFNATLSADRQRRQLKGCYIENPFAKAPVDPGLFPVESRYVVAENLGTCFRMEWR